MKTLKGKRILVTGATGFIGNRLVERLVMEHGAEVVALVHQFRNASRIARFPIRMIGGDVADPVCVLEAAQDCDAIVHAAVSFAGTPKENRRITLEGARNVCDAAKAVNARLVHFSTFSVYGETAPGPLDEGAVKTPGSDTYGASKLEAERLVQQYQKSGLAATILQPTIVYGPWAFWSTHAAALMARGVLALPENGMGLCNAVYVDDVLDAVFLALQSEKVLHGPYLISGYEPVTWRDYFLAHADGHGSERVGNMTEQEKASKSRQFLTAISLRTLLPPQLRYHLKGFIRELPGLKRLHNRSPWMQSAFRVLKGLLGFGVAMNAQPSGDAELQDKPRVLPNPDHLPLLVSRTLVQIELAKSELGYKSRFNLAQGATLTSEWLRWSGLHSE